MQWAESKRRSDRGGINNIGQAATAAAIAASVGRAPVSESLSLKKPSPASYSACAECGGRHPDVNRCPGFIARNDSSFTPTPGETCKWKIFMDFPCRGTNHSTKHHSQQLREEKGKGGGKSGRKGKGKGKGRNIAEMQALLDKLNEDDEEDLEPDVFAEPLWAAAGRIPKLSGCDEYEALARVVDHEDAHEDSGVNLSPSVGNDLITVETRVPEFAVGRPLISRTVTDLSASSAHAPPAIRSMLDAAPEAERLRSQAWAEEAGKSGFAGAFASGRIGSMRPLLKVSVKLANAASPPKKIEPDRVDHFLDNKSEETFPKFDQRGKSD